MKGRDMKYFTDDDDERKVRDHRKAREAYEFALEPRHVALLVVVGVILGVLVFSVGYITGKSQTLKGIETAKLPEGETGNVINLLDQRVWNLTPYFVSYTVSKTGLWTLTRSLALALAPRIRVNAIGPGPALRSPRQTEADFARQCEMTPLKRGTSPGEICDAVRFILAAPALTGQMIVLDGGQHLGVKLPPGVSLPPE